MHEFDPFGILHQQQKREATRREMVYTAWCAFAMTITLVLLVWGCA